MSNFVVESRSGKNKWFYLLFVISLLLSTICFAEQSKPMDVLYFEYPPFLSKSGGQKGIVIEITKMIFDEAKIPYTLKSVPVKRLLGMIAEGRYACAPGAHYTNERAQKGNYSKPIYTDKPIAVVYQKNTPFFADPKNITIKDLFTSDLKFGLIDGFRWPASLEEKIAEFNPKIKKPTVEVKEFLELLRIKRLDYSFLPPEMMAWHLSENKGFSSSLNYSSVGFPEGAKRYIYCSKAIPPHVLAAINAAIEKVMKSDSYKLLTNF